jgi:pimeloyl-ACP methyl ester carboxylesterase
MSTTAHTIRANGIDFACLRQPAARNAGPAAPGRGRTALLLHGFPDTAHTWSHQMPALADAGWQVVAPFLRGYPPSSVPQADAPGVYFDKATLVQDIAELIRALQHEQGSDAPVDLVAQDWGAIISYALLAAHPELVRRAVVMAVPHPQVVAASMLNPRHVQRSFHWWFFQLPDLPEQALAKDDFAFIDYLWRYWTTEGFEDAAYIRHIKDTLAQPGVLGATLGYYRAMLDPAKADPALGALRERMARTITVPTLALCGADDLRAELMREQAPHFAGEYRYAEVPKAGHFLHREAPKAVTQQVMDWLGRA